MRTAALIVALVASACSASADQGPTAPIAGADTCALARPEFGVATFAERALFAYDADAPLDLEKSVESTTDGIQVSGISYDSPDGGRVTGLLFDPVERSSLRPGIVLMHGLPGSAPA